MTTASLGIGAGSATDAIRLVTGGETAATKAAKAAAKERGLRLVLFGGGNLTIRTKSGVSSVRGYVSGDRIFVRADHPEFTADQIARHEAGHDMIAKGEIDPETVRERVREELGADQTERLAGMYEEAYRKTGLNADEVWEEVICDSLGDMNVFSGTALEGAAQELLEPAKAAADAEREANRTRGPPAAEGRASRELKGKYWRPSLKSEEWDLLNRKMEQGLGTGDDFIDSATKWLFASEKGVNVFAFYGIGDGTVATPLWAVGGQEAIDAIAALEEMEARRSADKDAGTVLDVIGEMRAFQKTGRDGRNYVEDRRADDGAGRVAGKGQQSDAGTDHRGGSAADEGVKGKSSQELESIEELRKASEEAEPYAGKDLGADSGVYGYDFLTALPDMQVVDLPEVGELFGADGRIDKAAVVRAGIKNARSIGVERDGKVFVRNAYTGKQLQVTADCIRHGLNGEFKRLLTDARLGAVIGDVVKNAVPINALYNKAGDVTGTYAMSAYAMDSQGREFIAIVTVESRTGKIVDLEAFDEVHAVSGRQKRGQASDPHTRSRGFTLSNLSTVSIADLLQIVNSTHQSILSEDVLNRLGETRSPEGEYTGQVKFSQELESIESLRKENQELRERLEEFKDIRETAKRKTAQAEYWKGQTRRTTTPPTVRQDDVRRLARKLTRDWSATVSYQDLAKDLTDLGEYLLRGETDTGEVDNRAVWEKAQAIGEKLVDSAQEQDETSREYAGLRDYLRKTKLTISEEDSRDIPDFGDFRKRNFGRLRLGKDGVAVDTAYKELSEMWPEFFDEGRESAPSDQLLHIAEVLDDIEPVYENPYSFDRAEAAQYAAEAALDGVMGESVRQQAPTFADRQAKKLELAVGKWKQATAREREKRKTKVLRDQITRHSKALSDKLLHPTDKQRIPEALRSTVANALASINQESRFTIDPKTGKRKKSDAGAPIKRSVAFRALRERYIAIAKEGGDMVVDPSLLGSAAEGVEGTLDAMISMGDIKLENMNSEQLTTVWQVLRAVERSLTTADKVLSDGKYERTSQWAAALETDTDTRRARRTLTKSGLTIDLETPYTYFSHFGESGKAVYRMLRNAQDRQQVMTDQVAQEVEKLVTPKQVKDLEKATRAFTVAGGQKLTLSTAQVMELYLLDQRPQAHEHLLVGGVVQPEVGKIRRGTDGIRLTEGDIKAITGTLTEEQRKIADGLQKLTHGLLADLGNEASMKAYGYKKFTEEHYWPIRSAKAGLYTSVEKGGDQPRSIKNIGLAKAVVPHADNPLDLPGVFTTFADHAGDMTDYAAWLCPMEDAGRLFNFKYTQEVTLPGGTVARQRTGKTVKGVLERYGGQGAGKYWTDLMEDIQNGIQGKSDSPATDLLSRGIGSFKGAAVGANLRVVIQQPTAFFRAAAVLSPADLARCFAGGVTKGRGWEKALKWSPIAKRKDAGGFDISSPTQMKEALFDSRSGLRKVNDALSAPAGMADAVTWGALWNACEWATAREDPSLQKGSDEFYRAVNERFTEVIDQTQVVDGVLQRSNIMRSSSALAQQATAFMGEPIMSLNLLTRAWENMSRERDPKRRGKAIKTFGRAVIALVATNVVNALAQSVLDAVRDDDEDKKYWERFLSAFTGLEGDEETPWEKAQAVVFGGNLGEGMNPIGQIPFAKDILSLSQGYDVSRTDMEVFADLVRAVQTAIQSAGGDGSKTRAYAVKELLTAGAKVFGIPVGNLARDTWGLIRSIAVETDNVSAQYEMEKAVYNITNSENNSRYLDILYRAYTQEDREVYQHIYNDMVENGVDPEKIRTGMDARAKKDQGVERVEDLESRYLSPDERAAYDETLGRISGSSVWREATEEQRDKAEDILYDLAVGNSAGVKLREKIEDGAEAGVSEADYVLYKLALDMADQPTESGKLGTYTNDEVERAIETLAGLSDEARSWLWRSQGKSETSDPWG